MKKRILSTLLALALCLSLLPTAAFAEEADAPGADTPLCTCETVCTADAMNAACPVCGAEGAAAETCGRTAAPETATVQALIDALPAVEDVTAADYDAVQDVCDAYEALTDGQQAQIVGLAKLTALLEWFSQQTDLTAGVQYLDANGSWKTVTDYTTVSSSTGNVTWENGGWYVVSSDVTISGTLVMAIRDVNLILCDGKTLTVEGGIRADGELALYGQSGGTGKLTVGASTDGDKSKSIVCYNLTVHGGSITATGGNVTGTGAEVQSFGIDCKGMTVTGGSLTATGGNVTGSGEVVMSRGIDCEDLTVNGGSVHATGGDATGSATIVTSCGIDCDDLTLTGGKITAVGGTVTASGTNSSLTEVDAISYGLYCYDMTITGGSIDATGGTVTCNANVKSYLYSYGINNAYDVTLKNGSVKATSGTVTYASEEENQGSVASKSIGFDFDDLTMESGTLTATAGTASTTLQTGATNNGKYRARSLALHGDDMVVRGGTVTATADDAAVHIKKGGYYASTYSCGIYADLTVTGGTITAASGENAEVLLDLPSAKYKPNQVSAHVYSCGIISYEGNMVYTGGTVTATSGGTSSGVGADYEGNDYDDCAVSHKFGIYSYEGHVSVTGGKIVGDVGGSGKIKISGGTIAGASTEAGATLTISGGTLDYVSVENDSTVVISGGTVETLYISPNATPVLSGGTFESITWLAAEDDSDTPNLVDALADGYAYYKKGPGSTTYDTLTTPSGDDWYSAVENVQIKAHTCNFVRNGDTYACDCGRTGHQEKIAYLDANGTTQYRVDYTVLDSSVAADLDGELSAGWYAVKGDVTLSDGIKLDGDVHLILCDNAKLSTAQISDDGTRDLTVYAQSTGNKMGSLLVGEKNASFGSAISLDGDLTVVGGNVTATAPDYGIDVSGDLTVLGGSVKGSGNVYGIYVSEEITVSGGVLEGVGGDEDNDDWGSTGIGCSLLSVTGGKIIGTGGTTQGEYSSDGIYIRDGMTVSGGIVEGTGGKASGTTYYAFSSGIYVYDDVTISGGTVTAKSATTDDDATHYSYGFWCNALTVSGGTITATAGIASATDNSALSYGLYCEDLTVSGGTITATGSKASGALTLPIGEERCVIASTGICCWDTNITGGTVTAKGDTAAYRGDYAITPLSYGMNCDNLTIKGGSLTATGSDAPYMSAGVFSDGEISATGGTLTAKIEQTSASDSAALYAEDGVTLGSSTKITTPSGGTVKKITANGSQFYTVVEQDSAAAKEVVIQKVSTSSGSSGGSSSAGTTVTVPVSSDHTSVDVKATVSKGNATVEVSDKQIEKVAADGAGNVTLDVSSLKDVTSATVPSHVVEKANEADDTSLTVSLPAGSVTLDETALSNVTGAADGKDVTISVMSVPTSALPQVVKDLVGMDSSVAAVVDVNLLVGTVKQSTFNGGKLTISIPYTPKAGEDTSKLTIWFIRDDGTIENKGGWYDAKNKCFVFETDHLSQYLLVNAPVNFSDVPANAYFYNAVNWAAARGITGGITATTFGPHQSCTRAQLVTFLWRAAGQPEPKATSSFTDVSADAYYAKAVAWAFENGIVGGYGNGLFGVNDTVTRQQTVAILYRFAQYTGMDTTQGGMAVREFSDYENIADYAVSAMQWAVNAGILQGNNGALNPTAPCTRAQIVTMLYRLLGE